MSNKTKTLIFAGIAIIAAYFIFSYSFPTQKANQKTNFKPASLNKTFGKYPGVKF